MLRFEQAYAQLDALETILSPPTNGSPVTAVRVPEAPPPTGAAVSSSRSPGSAPGSANPARALTPAGSTPGTSPTVNGGLNKVAGALSNGLRLGPLNTIGGGIRAVGNAGNGTVEAPVQTKPKRRGKS